MRSRTELHRARAGADAAVGYVDGVVGTARIIGFQADAVVGRIDVTTGDAHVAAVGDVQPVVVPVGPVVYGKVVHHHVAAQLQRHAPAGTVAQGYVAQRHTVRMRQAEQLGPCRLARTLATVVVVGVNAHTPMVQAVDIQGQLQSLPVYHALPRDADVPCPVGHNQCQGRIVLGVGRHRLARHALRTVVIGVRTAQQYRSPLQVQPDIGLQFDTPGDVGSSRQAYHAASPGSHIVYHPLQLLGLHRLQSGLHAPVCRMIQFFLCRHCHPRQQAAAQHSDVSLPFPSIFPFDVVHISVRLV